ncbi:MAG: nucleotidyltransferase family protein [Peptostreptococcus stomatis]|uniref:tRNA(Met) cytidine acetate ligase n=1 Tax=Peptostreptococcus stomatis TaxID=341694 RepID=UPI001A4D2CBD|nr:nucleotidyltransferase family protein [Peptostreptococcus stomatis]MBL6466018.1 nucleotidyltransferase family protein [Peptostreptococcus stomatis]
MKIGGIIAEYNPFHKGHSYQIEEFKRISSCSHLVVAMSGNFVQRGGPALVDKYARAQMALDKGVDLVIEIPSIFAGQTAEIFARGGLLSLNSLDCVDSFCFGSEDGNIDRLTSLADFIYDQADWIDQRVRDLMKGSLSYARAREEAIKEGFKDFDLGNILTESNNILGLEYLKEARRLGSPMEPVTIRRKGSSYNCEDLGGDLPSASAIRKTLLGSTMEIKPGQEPAGLDNLGFRGLDQSLGMALDKSVLDIIKDLGNQGIGLMGEESFFQEISYIVARDKGKLDGYFEVNGGLDKSIEKVVLTSASMEDTLENLTNKSHTRAKLRRALYNILLGIRRSDLDQVKLVKSLPYIRVLGMTERGRDILRMAKERSGIEIVTSPAKALDSDQYRENALYRQLLDIDLRTSAIYYQKYHAKNPDLLARGQADFFDTKFNF